MPTTWGLSELKDNVPTRNALAVDRLLGAGVVLFGKTNVPSWLADWQSFNPVYGTTNNPWDLTRTPGGSSGGSAAALAAGLTGFEAGSDIGSSIRNPAHYCGVYGHKPTFGIVPPRGQALPGRVAQGDISVIGPMGRSADDLALGLSVMAGADEIDGAGWRLELPAPRQKTLRDFKVAVMLTDPVSEVDAEVQARVQAVAEFLAKQKAKVSDTARPAIDTAEAQRVYVFLLRAATAGRQTSEEFARNAEIARGLRPDDESYYARMTRANVALAPRLAGRQRGAPPDALALGRVLPRLRSAAVPGRGERGLPARPGGRAPRADHPRQRPPRAHHRPALLGRLLRAWPSCPRRWRPRGSRARACPSACRSSARSTVTARASSWPACSSASSRASFPRRATSRLPRRIHWRRSAWS